MGGVGEKLKREDNVDVWLTHSCTAETYTTLYSDYTPIKKEVEAQEWSDLLNKAIEMKNDRILLNSESHFSPTLLHSLIKILLGELLQSHHILSDPKYYATNPSSSC